MVAVMPQVTLDLDSGVLEQLRERSRREQTTVGALASRLLAAQFAADRRDIADAAPLAWVSRDLGLPRIDLEDKDALYAILDADQARGARRLT